MSVTGPRQLIYVPIIHDPVDMGTKAEALRQAFIGRFGIEQWERRRSLIAEIWGGIRRKLLRRPLPWNRVQIYQDGLPVSGKELDIAREVAAQGSQNYRLVLELVARGATLMGTESPELLIREYQMISRMADPGAASLDTDGQGRELLRSRDEYMAHRIDDTLDAAGIGVLFLGMMHQVDQQLPADIAVEFLIDRLPLSRVAEED